VFAIDLTSNKVVVACKSNNDIQLWSFSWLANFRQDGESIIATIGKDTSNNSVTLHDLRDNFPRIYDRDVQYEIIVQLLNHIAEISGFKHTSMEADTSVILPYGYSSETLGVIEAGFQKSDSGLVLSNFINECVAAIIYFFETAERYSKLRPNPSGDSFCFINATDVPVRAFIADYHESEDERSLIVKDYFQALENSFHSLRSGLKTVVFGNPDFKKPSGNLVDSVESKDKCRVMSAGGIILNSGRFRSGKNYVIEGAFNFGIQIDSDRLCQIVPKDTLISNPVMPLERSKAFVIDNITHDVNINLYCGFSDRLEGAISLGTITLHESQFPQNREEIVVSVRLDSMHSGRFSVTQVSSKREPISKSFSVPGWLG